MAFSGCAALRVVRIPPFLEKIYQEAFLNCDALSVLEFARFPKPGSQLYEWWKEMILKTRLAFNMYYDQKLTPELAHSILKAAQEADNTKLITLMTQYLLDNEKEISESDKKSVE